jgi:crotonobetainyl-CoA:carnitine CoA-transferase CaiB-like acyl-CoA transferase
VDAPPSAGAEEARSAGSVANNVGKRSIVLDLKSQPGVNVALALAARADVLVENFTPGVMASLGLTYDEVSRNNPAIVYASISGFGQTGPLSHRRAYGAVAHAESGWLWVQQQAQGGSEPFAPGVTVADIVTATNAVIAILAALFDRASTRQGQWIDITLAESQMAMLSEVARPALEGEAQEAWRPFRHPIHKARDGYVTINLGSDRNWRRIALALGHLDTLRPPQAEKANA